MNQKELLVISVTIFVTIIAWVMTELYVIHTDTPTEEEIEAVSLDYTFNTKILDALEQKVP